MAEPLRNVAVLLAGGVGTRIGLGIPKQLVEIAGKTILEHTIARFAGHRQVDEVIVLMASGHLDAATAIVRDGGYRKVVDVLEGAETRSGTTMRALDRLGDEECNVLLHDAVRPLVTDRIIGDCLQALQAHRAVDVAIPSTDTVIEVTAENTIGTVLPRRTLRRSQTPQGFRASVIKEAYRRAAADPDFETTDDCSVVVQYLPEEPVWVVAGEGRNFKITEPLDIKVAELLLQGDPIDGSSAGSG